MSEQPPSPPTPSSVSQPVDDERIRVTTSQLVGHIEKTLDCRLDEDILEALLLELDRGDYVEWVTVTRDGEYVWDLTESPDRIADAVAEAAVERLVTWLERDRST